MSGRLDRDALLASTDLRDLADELLGPSTGQRHGPRSTVGPGAGAGGGASLRWRCPNPTHQQSGRTPPVNVFTGRRGEQRWRCHGCGIGGTAIDLVLACDGGSVRDAMDFLAGRVERGGAAGAIERGSQAARRPATPPAGVVAGCVDHDGVDRYVHECAERLWTPHGRRALEWLTGERGLLPEVLRRNLVGVDLGPRRQSRPDGMPRVRGVVLPVIDDGRGVYAQIRTIDAGGERPRYLNPTSTLATNPKMTRARPAQVRHDEIVVTEGAIDALSAATLGYRAVGVLSAAYSDAHVATALARLPHLLVIAFDADPAGKAAATRISALLTAQGRPPRIVDLGTGDLNDALRDGRVDRRLHHAAPGLDGCHARDPAHGLAG